MFFESTHAKIYFETHGENGPWVTLINGHTRASTDFRMFSRYLAERNFRVLIFDNRGAGRTESSGAISMDDFLADVVALWDHLQIGKSHVLGISMGGMISMHLALSEAHRLFSLCLISTTPSEKWMLPRGGEWKDDEEVVRKKMTVFFSDGYLKRNPFVFEAIVKQTLQAIRNAQYIEKSDDQKSAFRNIELQTAVQKIHVPTLILHGNEDKAVSEEAPRYLHNAIQGSQLHIFEGAGHLLLAECPKDVYARYVDFISQL